MVVRGRIPVAKLSDPKGLSRVAEIEVHTDSDRDLIERLIEQAHREPRVCNLCHDLRKFLGAYCVVTVEMRIDGRSE